MLSEILTGKTYDSDNAKKWTINIANKVNEKVRGLCVCVCFMKTLCFKLFILHRITNETIQTYSASNNW